MDSSLSVKSLLVQSLLFLAPALVSAQNATSSPLSSCLTDAGVRNVIDTDSTWATEAAAWQLRIPVDPAAVAFPSDKTQLAASLACARNASVKVSALAGGHSFAAFGFGDPGNLVINMEEFQQLEFDTKTNYLTMGGGVRVGPALKFLWDGYGRHFPHVRHGRPGIVGSSIGGGFGSTSRFLGTPMDNLRSVEYMLYNGTVVNAKRGSDLFWAASGAGSSYGVITSVVYKTWKPTYPTAVNFTLSLGAGDLDYGVKSLLAIQDYATTEAPDTFAIRWSLSASPYSCTGYFYGNPAKFNATVKPLMDRLGPQAVIRSTEQEFWTLETQVATGSNLPNGGVSAGRSFYTQALTVTTDGPLTYSLVKTLFEQTTPALNRTDLSKSGLLDLWGGVSRDVVDADTSYTHGHNLWLIRFDMNARNAALPYPADAVAYAKSLMIPFENAIKAADIPLRGFANYRDSALSEKEWSSRLYGEENYRKLKALKKVYDPEGIFTSNSQSIPV